MFPSSDSVPDWVGQVASYWPDVSNTNLSSARSGCIVTITLGSRVFLISFGLGHLKINKKEVVHDFGRRVAINAINPDTVKQVARQALEGSFIQAIESAARSGSVYQFGIDIERDLLQGIFGRCRKRAFGTAIGGATSLRISVDGNLGAIIDRLPIFFRLFSQKIRSPDFLWYERIKLVEDVAEIAILDGALDAHITAGGPQILMGLPQTLTGVDQICGFRFERGSAKRPAAQYPDPEFTDWVAWCTQKGLVISLATASSKSLFVDFQSGNEIPFPIAESIFWEYVKPSGQSYIRHDGEWFEIDSHFVAEVKSFISAMAPTGLTLPKYTGGTEAIYNVALSGSIPSSSVLDGNNITIPGAKTAIEPCDVYSFDSTTKKGFLFFVKRKKVGSSGLTHLFSQMLAGVDSFFHRDHVFRTAMISVFPNTGSGLGFRPTTRPEPRQWTIALVICDSKGTATLPFLSQVTLKRVVESLRSRYDLTFRLEFV